MKWAIDILKQYWGYDSFRGIQEQIIESVYEGNDTLGLMPTGGGKSICFQVPALAMEGICIVVTPLISLMKDQVAQLRAQGIKAETVYSGMMRSDIVRVLDNCVLGDYKFLYISPERLSSDLFLAKLQRFRKISMIVIDEAHCISQWGYDFRPSYLKIADIRNIIPYHVPVLALTATATPKVVDDIQERLRFARKNSFSMSFERKNIIYVVRNTFDKPREILKILNGVKQGSGIVYVRSRQLTTEIANYLNQNGVTALAYHAGLTNAEKDYRQNLWSNSAVRVMVATNAFGMGINKPDVRIVIHYSLPDSIEAYYQEAGRAGRDGKTSYAVLLYDKKDSTILRKRVPETYPEIDYVRRVYESACYFLQVGIGEAHGKTFYFPIDQFCRTFKLFPVPAINALKLLNNAGYIEWHDEQEFKSAVRIIVNKEGLYHLKEDKQTDLVLQSLLRSYTGIFADFVYIEESLIAHSTGLDANEVYQTLKELHHNRVIDFIPHRKTPTFTFAIPRVDPERIDLSPMVYADRKKDYIERTEHIAHYADSLDTCRSRMLLSYFGEDASTDCGQCDVCIMRRQAGSAQKDSACKQKANAATIKETIAKVLEDGQPHTFGELQEVLKFTETEEARIAIKEMVEQEEVTLRDGMLVKRLTS